MNKSSASLYAFILLLTTTNLFAQSTHTVCASGCDFTTIQAAISAAANGDNIAITDAVHTENSILVNKSLNICGGVPGTIVQAAANPGDVNFRIFTISRGRDVTINDLIIQNGSAPAGEWGGAIYNNGDLGIVNCILRNNSAHRGGAIYSSRILVIINSTIQDNTVEDFNSEPASGGGIYAAGTFGMVNTTVSGNINNTMLAGMERGDGGGITTLAGSIVGFYYNTIANNTIGVNGFGAGYSAQTGSVLDLANNIIANNIGSVDIFNEGLLLPSQNLTNIVLTCGGGTCPLTFITDNPELQPLADNGGCTPTHNLAATSPAIDAATILDEPVIVDQRGADRNLPDIGAVEYTLTVPPCLTSLLCEALLPVEYLSFTAKAQEQTVVLDWVTAVEVNNEGFAIERSGDGVQWEKIEFVSGAGTIAIPTSYQYEDRSPRAGTNYYRLKQIDFDGQYEYSNVISAEISTRNNDQFRIFPNPANQLMTIQLPDDQLPYQLRLRNSLGQLVWEKQSGDERTHRIQFSEFELASGTYWLSKTPVGRTGGATQTFKVLINLPAGN